MKIKAKDIAQKAGLKLNGLRNDANMTRREMAAALDITPSAYRKNELGLSIPSVNALKQLIGRFGISMDWFLFDRGPKLYDDRLNTEAVEQRMDQLKQDHEARIDELRDQLDQDHQAQIKELQDQLQLARLKIRGKEQQALRSGEDNALPGDVREMTDAMKKIPLLHYDILSHFHRFKRDNHELFQEKKASKV